MASLNELLKSLLSRRGWFLRRSVGLPAGIELERDFLVRAGLAAPKIVFDVGAHCGETAGRFATDFPAARIYSFEPVQSSFATLAAAAAAWPNVECHHLALGDREMEIEIALQPDSQTNTLLARASDSPGARKEKVTVTTVDAFAASHGISRIDLLKIDTEGFELAVLAGASRLLTDGAVGAIFVEASLDPDDKVHTPLSQITKVLEPLGFRLTSLYDQVIWRSPVRLAYFNALFVRSST